MEKLLELDDITLLPSLTNSGAPGNKAIFTVSDPLDNSGIVETLPIFTSPMEAIVGENSAKIWSEYGIRPVIPRTESLEVRLSLCKWVFASFSIPELQRTLIGEATLLPGILHICIDYDNGHDVALLNTCYALKNKYKGQILIMGGNVANPETYLQYSKAGFDYMRVGISADTMVDKDKYGFHYPMASLLMNIARYKVTGAIGARPVKIIADGGIESPCDILKAMALGADYVMIGKEFSRVLEAEGLIYIKSKNPKSGETEIDEVPDQEKYYGTSGLQAQINGFCRSFHGNTTDDIQARRAGYTSTSDWKTKNPGAKMNDSAWTWVDIDISLSEWVDEFKDCTRYGFCLANAKGWTEFKKNIRFGRV